MGWAYVQLGMSLKVVSVCFQGLARRSRRVRRRFVHGSREISLASSLHRASTEIIAEQLQSKATITKQNRDTNTSEADELYDHLPDSMQKAVDLAREKGASTWLTVLPLANHGFTLHKIS